MKALFKKSIIILLTAASVFFSYSLNLSVFTSDSDYCVVYADEETDTDENEQAEYAEENDGNESAVEEEADYSRPKKHGHIFSGFWECYFSKLGDLMTNFKATMGTMISRSVMGFVMSGALILFSLFFVILTIKHVFVVDGSNNVVSDYFSADSGCLGAMLKLIAVTFILSPFISIITYIGCGYDARWYTVLFTAIFIQILILVLGFAAGALVYAVIYNVLKLISDKAAQVIALIAALLVFIMFYIVPTVME